MAGIPNSTSRQNMIYHDVKYPFCAFCYSPMCYVIVRYERSLRSSGANRESGESLDWTGCRTGTCRICSNSSIFGQLPEIRRFRKPVEPLNFAQRSPSTFVSWFGTAEISFEQ